MVLSDYFKNFVDAIIFLSCFYGNFSMDIQGWGAPIRKYLQIVHLYTDYIRSYQQPMKMVPPSLLKFSAPQLVRPECSFRNRESLTYVSRVQLGAWTTSSGSSPATSTNPGPRGSRHGAPRWRGRAPGHPRPTRRDRARSRRSASWGWGSADP